MWWWIRPMFNTGLAFALISYLIGIAAQCMEEEGYFYIADALRGIGVLMLLPLAIACVSVPIWVIVTAVSSIWGA